MGICQNCKQQMGGDGLSVAQFAEREEQRIRQRASLFELDANDKNVIHALEQVRKWKAAREAGVRIA